MDRERVKVGGGGGIVFFSSANALAKMYSQRRVIGWKIFIFNFLI